jgi:hypothetical protein
MVPVEVGERSLLKERDTWEVLKAKEEKSAKQPIIDPEGVKVNEERI